VMFTNRKERAELLEGLVINNKDPTIPKFVQVISAFNSSGLFLLICLLNMLSSPYMLQKIHLLWGENDQIFKLEHAQNMKEYVFVNMNHKSMNLIENI